MNTVKKLIISITLILSFISNAGVLRKDSSRQSKGEVSFKESFPFNPYNSPNKEPMNVNGWSRYFRFCAAEADRDWTELVKELPTGSQWVESIKEFKDKIKDAKIKELIEKDDNCKYPQQIANDTSGEIKNQCIEHIKKIYGDLIQEYNTRYENYFSCHALMYMTIHTDYEDEKLISSGGEVIYASNVNPNLKCYAKGQDTQDYKSCKTLITAYDAAFIGGAVMKKVQNIDYQSHLDDSKAQLSSKSTGELQTQDFLDTQKSQVNKQRDMTNQTIAFNAAKVATLYTLSKKLPTKESLVNECISKYKLDIKIDSPEKVSSEIKYIIQNKIRPDINIAIAKHVNSNNLTNMPQIEDQEIEKIFNDSENKPLDYEIDPNNAKEELCNSPFDSTRNMTNLVLNGPAKTAINQELIISAADMLGNMFLANKLKKMEGNIGGVISDINDYKPEEFEELQEILVTLCEAEPNHERCKDAEKIRFASNNLVIGGNPAATSTGQLQQKQVNSNNNDASNSPNRKNIVGNVASLIDPADKNSGLSEIVPAGVVKTGGGGANPAAGGGGGAAGGGGGGAAPASGSGQRAPQQAEDTGKSVAYKGSASGSLIFSGGARKSAVRKKTNNPFSKLFGKDKTKKKGSVINFRNVASKNSINGKNTNLFEMISGRYKKVNKQNQLLIYNIEK